LETYANADTDKHVKVFIVWNILETGKSYGRSSMSFVAIVFLFFFFFLKQLVEKAKVGYI